MGPSILLYSNSRFLLLRFSSVSRCLASVLLEKDSVCKIFHGLYGLVDRTPPLLCFLRRSFKSPVDPIYFLPADSLFRMYRKYCAMCCLFLGNRKPDVSTEGGSTSGTTNH